ncbi:hypothetical protein BGZ73_002747 [Actinomortierella ambigua]|nr:hypothetical protein BGZ73_002747 [Actinomortierella ambigua]
MAYGSGWSSPVGERTSTTPAGTGGPGSAFDADMLADILIQYQAHAKACFQEIQEHQRALGTKIRNLDTVATQALQGLLAVQYQTRAHVDQLHFVQALARQTEAMSKTLTGTLEKLSRIVSVQEEGRDDLPGGTNLVDNSLASLLPPIDRERYPHLHAFINQPSQSSTSHLTARPAPPPTTTTTVITPSPSLAGSLSTVTLATTATQMSPSSPAVQSGDTNSGAAVLISSALPATTMGTATMSSGTGGNGAPSLAYSGPASAKTRPLTGAVTGAVSDIGSQQWSATRNETADPLEQEDGDGDRLPGIASGSATTPNAPFQPQSTAMATGMIDGSGGAGGGLGVVEGLSGLMSMLTRTINDGASTLAGVSQEIQRHTSSAFMSGGGGGIVRPPLVTATAATAASGGQVDATTTTVSQPTSASAGIVSEATANLRRLVRTPSLQRPGRTQTK